MSPGGPSTSAHPVLRRVLVSARELGHQVACGCLGCALVQIPYLDHGDLGVRWRAALEPRS
jgi:hypothetical protein